MTEPNNHQVPETQSAGYIEPESPRAQWPDAPTPTGDALVDRALAMLDGVADSPVGEHGELYAGLHDSLLAALDSEPGLPAVPIINRPEGDS